MTAGVDLPAGADPKSPRNADVRRYYIPSAQHCGGDARTIGRHFAAVSNEVKRVTVFGHEAL